jgi:WhiB family transcriptional regulator, redox-sensing transcriptional regulator
VVKDLTGLDRSWETRANCRGVDPDLFFPERGASAEEAKAVCQGCAVRAECLEYALAAGENLGIWGGTNARQRRAIRRQRRRAAAEGAA